MNSVRWNVAVSADTDQSVRMFLAGQGGGRKGELSRFIEEAVRSHILELTAEDAKAANAHINEAELAMNSVRWNVAVSADTDQSVRMFLAGQGGGRKGELSRFIEEAVRSHILELTAEDAKAANAHINEAELAAIVAEAVHWARNP